MGERAHTKGRVVEDGGPAFPQFDIDASQRDGHGDLIEPFTVASGGMSLRDWFAGQIINGIVSNREQWLAYMADRGATPAEAYVAEVSYDLADAMLKARGVRS